MTVFDSIINSIMLNCARMMPDTYLLLSLYRICYSS